MPTIVIAGATGYLGRHLVSVCRARGWTVRAIARPGKTVRDAHETVHADVTDPASIRGVFDGADLAFSALGITRQTDKVTYEDIEYTANAHLLDEAIRSGVARFGVISVARVEAFRGLAITESRERFVSHLQQRSTAGDIDATVVRATGFFSDMGDVFEMAEQGRIFLVGDGTCRVNPIHGTDLATACADALEQGQDEVSVGGPETFTWNEVATLAFDVTGKRERVARVPAWLIRWLLPVVRVFSQRAFDVGSFILRGATTNVTAPPTGTHTLRDHYEALHAEHSA